VIEARRWSGLGEFATYCRRHAAEHGVDALLPAIGVTEAMSSLDSGSNETAFEQFQAARDLAERIGDPWWTGLADLGLAETCSALGIGEAAHHRARAIDAFTRLGSIRELERALAVVPG
jgi:hypothetical protein